ncbi:MAG: cytochrome c peroxidase [Candidatus Eisenbacteria bacterium]
MSKVESAMRFIRRGAWLPFVAVAVAIISFGCSDDDSKVADPETDLRARFDLQTLPAIPYPPDNPPRQERIALGRLLFFDPLLGGEMDVACGTCHHPDFAFADRRQFGAGVSGSGLGPNRLVSTSSVSGELVALEPRNTPTVFNTAFNMNDEGAMSFDGFQFWDGRVKGLEVQATKPITSRVEMRGDAYGMDDAHATAVSLDSVLTRIRAVPEYEARFRDAFPDEALEVDQGTRSSVIDSSTYARAIASYERELVTRNTAYDRYVLGDDKALNARQLRGLEVFFTKGRCNDCHSGPMFSDFTFVCQAVPQEGTGKVVIPGDDAGREEFTHDPNDRYMFRTPTLRNAELTPPYMHDGVFESLEEVVRFYNDGAVPRHPAIPVEQIHPSVRAPLGLTDQEMSDLVESS